MVPVMSVRGCEGVIAAQKCYVRKPGPRSEPGAETASAVLCYSRMLF